MAAKSWLPPALGRRGAFILRFARIAFRSPVHDAVSAEGHALVYVSGCERDHCFICKQQITSPYIYIARRGAKFCENSLRFGPKSLSDKGLENFGVLFRMSANRYFFDAKMQ